MNTKTVNTTDTIAKFERDIAKNWNLAKNNILETCRVLAEAKATLSDSQFKDMKLPWRKEGQDRQTRQTTNRLVAIGKDEKLQKFDDLLPPSWGTLYELTKIKEDDFAKYVEDGKVSPSMTRADAVGLVKGEPQEEQENLKAGKVVAFTVYASDDDQAQLLLETYEATLNPQDVEGVYVEGSVIERLIKEQEREAERKDRKAYELAYDFVKKYWTDLKNKEKPKGENAVRALRKANAELVEFFDDWNKSSIYKYDDRESVMNFVLNSIGGEFKMNDFTRQAWSSN